MSVIVHDISWMSHNQSKSPDQIAKEKVREQEAIESCRAQLKQRVIEFVTTTDRISFRLWVEKMGEPLALCQVIRHHILNPLGLYPNEADMKEIREAIRYSKVAISNTLLDEPKAPEPDLLQFSRVQELEGLFTPSP